MTQTDCVRVLPLLNQPIAGSQIAAVLACGASRTLTHTLRVSGGGMICKAGAAIAAVRMIDDSLIVTPANLP